MGRRLEVADACLWPLRRVEKTLEIAVLVRGGKTDELGAFTFKFEGGQIVLDEEIDDAGDEEHSDREE